MSLLYERHHRDLFGYFYRLTNNPAQSEDLVQNVFYRLIKYKESYRGEGKFVYWLFSIAKNTWWDSLRKKKLVDTKKEINELKQYPSHERNAEDQLINHERKQLLKKALQQIAPEKREAIVLSRFHGFKYSEIAQLSGCTENAIKARVSRGLIELKNIMLKLENQ